MRFIIFIAWIIIAVTRPVQAQDIQVTVTIPAEQAAILRSALRGAVFKNGEPVTTEGVATRIVQAVVNREIESRIQEFQRRQRTRIAEAYRLADDATQFEIQRLLNLQRP